MSAIRPRQRRRSSSLGWLIALPVLTLLVGGIGTVSALLALGTIPWPWAAEPQGPPPGTIPIPAAAQPIPAYTAVKLEHLVDPNTGQIKWLYLPEKNVPGEAIRSPTEIVGRVMRRDKSAGFAFQESEFLPKGTRSGVVGGIPPGKRALTLEASKIGGIHALQLGDRLDLLASAAIDEDQLPSDDEERQRLLAHNPELAAGKADVRVIVHDGVIVSPVTTRGIPTTSSSLTQGARTTLKPVQEVVIAVNPEEVAPLNEAIALEMRIMAVARSGHPEDPGAVSVTPGSPPIEVPPPPEVQPEPEPEPTTVTELIIGDRRETLVYRKDPGETSGDRNKREPSLQN